MMAFSIEVDEGCLQTTWYNARGNRCVDDVRDGLQEDVKVFIKKRGSQDLADALLIVLRQIHQ